MRFDDPPKDPYSRIAPKNTSIFLLLGSIGGGETSYKYSSLLLQWLKKWHIGEDKEKNKTEKQQNKSSESFVSFMVTREEHSIVVNQIWQIFNYFICSIELNHETWTTFVVTLVDYLMSIID